MMATFHIHEDIVHAFKNQKKLNNKKKVYPGKKFISQENRCILQPIDNGVVQDSKRVKWDDSNKENGPSPSFSSENEIKEDLNSISDHSFLREEFLKANITDESIQIKEQTGHTCDAFEWDVEYRYDIWNYLKHLEITFPSPKPTYMMKQPDLSWNTRAILVDWLASVNEEYKLCQQTFHLSVNYVDRFLSQMSVVRNKFQLVGAAAMMLAGKVEDVYPPDVKEWSYLTGDAFSPRQILKMEQLLLKVLKFRMQPPTMQAFIEQMCSEHNLDNKTMHLAQYLSELVLLEGQDYMDQLPSKLAAACILLARYNLAKQNPWPKKLKDACGYSIKQLSPVVQRQHKTFEESPLKDQQAIQKKYKKEKYNRVALLKPRSLTVSFFEEEDE